MGIKEATNNLNIKQPIVRESLRFYKFFENLELLFCRFATRSGIGSAQHIVAQLEIV